MSWLSFIEYGLEPSVHRGEELFITYIPGEESKLDILEPQAYVMIP